MIKKLLLSFVLFGVFCSSSLAINWIELSSGSGKAFSLDTDSIVEYQNCYFYNIMYKLQNGDYQVATVQSKIATPLSKRIKVYTKSEYESLNGDYQNITNNISQTFEAVTFDSIVSSAFKKVKEIMQSKNINKGIIYEQQN